MEIFAITKLPISVLILIIKASGLIFQRIKNLLFRPKLSFDLKPQRVMFKGDDDKEHLYPYLCLLINNFTNIDYHLNPKTIAINNERYIVMIQAENNFSRLNSATPNHWKECGSDIYPMYKNNWSKILEGNFYFTLTPYDTKIFPLKPIKSSSHVITAVKRKPLLFFHKSKVSITLEIDKKVYEYGICRKYCYERLINYLAFFHEVKF